MAMTTDELVSLARRYWETYLPKAHAELENPDEHFQTLAHQVEDLVDERAEDLAGKAPEGETFEDRLGRIRNAETTAWAMILDELVYLTPEPGRENEELPPA
ncbi:hypothetical protein ACWCSD_40580 [Nonomuraea sp. NPDC001684]